MIIHSNAFIQNDMQGHSRTITMQIEKCTKCIFLKFSCIFFLSIIIIALVAIYTNVFPYFTQFAGEKKKNETFLFQQWKSVESVQSESGKGGGEGEGVAGWETWSTCI